MSQNNKPSLWQKLKQLLSPSAPQPPAEHTQKGQQKEQIAESADEPSVADTDNSATAAKVSLTKKNRDNPETPIVDSIKQYLHNKQWHYTYYRPTTKDSHQSHHLSMRMRNKDVECGYLFRVQEDNALLAIYGILPFTIPESHQSAAMLLMTQINYDMLIGNLEMDVNDGEIRYKNAIDVEAVGIDDVKIEHLLQSVVAMTTVAYELFSDLINTPDPSENMSTLLIELREQADARTFFLPTQLIQ